MLGLHSGTGGIPRDADMITNRLPLLINDAPTPPPLIVNNPGAQKLSIIRVDIY